MLKTNSKPFASIIIPVYNKVEYTRKCISSILADTDRPVVEIIVVDNGSTDGTREYLESIAHQLAHEKDNLMLVFNKSNLGVAPAWNQGAKMATTKYLAIINNDIVVTNGWLRSLIWSMDIHHLSLVSPFAATGVLNYDLEKRAQSFTEKNLSRIWYDYDFCAFLTTKKTYEQIGPFDENYKVGGYEDTDYVYRLKKLDLKYAVTGASFIHHFGSSTLGDFKKEGDKHVPHNREYFISKWGFDPSLAENSFAKKLRKIWKRFKLNWDRM